MTTDIIIPALTNEDLRFVVTRLPKDIRSLAQDAAIVIGGGFIRETVAGNQPKDIDIFGATKEVLTLAAKMLHSKREGRYFESKNAITVLSGTRMPVQFITRWLFSEPAAVVQSFDFTVCQAAVWFNKGLERWESVIGDGFYPDLAARRLVYTFPQREEEAGGSMLRVQKFLQRGYSIQAPSLAGVIARVAMSVRWGEVEGRGLTKPKQEQEVARVISGLLREVDPNITVDGIDVVDEHEILNEARVS